MVAHLSNILNHRGLFVASKLEYVFVNTAFLFCSLHVFEMPNFRVINFMYNNKYEKKIFAVMRGNFYF